MSAIRSAPPTMWLKAASHENGRGKFIRWRSARTASTTRLPPRRCGAAHEFTREKTRRSAASHLQEGTMSVLSKLVVPAAILTIASATAAVADDNEVLIGAATSFS